MGYRHERSPQHQDKWWIFDPFRKVVLPLLNLLDGRGFEPMRGTHSLRHFELLLLCSEGQQSSLSPRETSGVVGSKVENTFDNRNDTAQKQAHCMSEAHSCTNIPHTTKT